MIRAAERGGAGEYNDPGGHVFMEAHIEMTLRNQHVKLEDLFFL